MRRAAALLALLLAAGAPLAAPPATAEPPPPRPARAAETPPARLVETGRIFLAHPDPAFGGLSGIDTDAAGETFVAVGDRGLLVTGRLLREGGRLAGVTDLVLRPLLNTRGRPLTPYMVDAEDIALDGQGGFHVSFEAEHRIWHYAAPGAPARRSPGCPDFAALQLNSGLEALARAPDGTLLAIPERSGAWGRPFPVYRIRDGRCIAPLALPRHGGFLVTGADVGPDGRLYVLERDHRFWGFATRIRRFALGEDGLSAEETLLETAFGTYGNLEGIAVFRDAEGAIRVLAVADDNFSPFQRTDLVEFRLEDGESPAVPGPEETGELRPAPLSD